MGGYSSQESKGLRSRTSRGGIVTDNAKNGKILNTPEDGGCYISYDRVEDARKGDLIVTYCVYNPYTNWEDDVIERWDFIE